MAQTTILVSDGNGVNWQHRLRCNADGDDSWHACVTDNGSLRDTVQDGNTNSISQQWQNNGNVVPNRYLVDRNYYSFDMSAVPGDATITAVSVILTTITTSRLINDSDAEKFRLIKGTDALDGVTSPNGSTTANAVDHTVNNGSDVNGSASNLTDITFDLGSSGLFDWVVAQHAAGQNAHMYCITKLEYDTFLSSGATEPSGQNYSGFTAINYSTSAQRPRIVVDYTEAPPPEFANIKIGSGSVTVVGNMKVVR